MKIYKWIYSAFRANIHITKEEPRGQEDKNMKYTVEAIENAKNGMSWKEIGCNFTFGQAYLYSKKAGNELPNFGEVIWDYDIEEIIEDCRKFGVKEFTISSTYSNLITTMARFEELGCTLDGIVKIKSRIADYHTGEHDTIPAFKMTVKEA